MLVSAVDGGVDAHRPVQVTGRVSIGQQSGVDPIPGPVGAEPFVPIPHRLPRIEVLGQITPGNSGPEPVDDPFDDLAVIAERASPLAFRG